ncbi:carbohydrate kinase family protein [Rhizobium sp. YJ-22]|uniref:carbohydrate kinase family protein n=1 Tax=Rhizobium sp. YJ-22 TaxID=3037556 RepID=UPI002412211F|nr:carbohydrate kinase family protein [Rhizobium sp. YJ-22]MDG3579083.1 carbohydrate kinase family protein [Rhizobium sp. YJ-22]
MAEREEAGADERKGGVVCAGNFIVDRIHSLSYWPEQGNLTFIRHQDIGVGGGAINVATDLASMGFPGRLAAAGCVGADADGDFVRQRLLQAGIGAEGLVALGGQATAHTHVMTVPGQSRTFFYHGGANDKLEAGIISPQAYAEQGYRLFYLGYLMLLPGLDRLDSEGRSGASRLLEAAQKAGLVTCVDFVSSEDAGFSAQVGASLPFCDYIVINEMEAGSATGIRPRDAEGKLLDAAVRQAGARLLEAGVSKGVVIHAPEACFWFSPGRETVVMPSRPIDPASIVSPVGAGDAFCAAVVYGLHEGWAIERIIPVAHAAAARCLGGATATDGIPMMDILLADAFG